MPVVDRALRGLAVQRHWRSEVIVRLQRPGWAASLKEGPSLTGAPVVD